VGDYVSGFLGLSEGNAWNMDAVDVCHKLVSSFEPLPMTLLQPIKLRNGQVVERGEGNHVSVEFNLLYRVRHGFQPPIEANLVDITKVAHYDVCCR
jgi:linoleate 10R-lipoxygenase